MYLKIKLLLLCLIGGLSLYGQSFMYSYIDPCTQEMKTIVYDMTAPIVVSYYGQTRAFTYTEMQNGEFDSWLSVVYSQYTAQPCQGILTTITTTSSTTLTTNVINTILNLSTITSISSMGGIGNNIGSTVNTGANVKEKKGGKNEKNNNNNNTNPNNSNPVPNTATSSSPNSNPAGTNVGGNASSGTSSGGEQGAPTTNPEGGTTTGETPSPETGGTTTNPGQTGGSGGTVGTGSNPNGSGSGTQSSQNETPSPTQDEINKTKTDQQKATSSNVAKTTSKAKNETNKPAILLTGDIVGLQKTTDSTQDARGTISYTRVKGDGTASLGISADYMVNAKIGNITVMKSWIATKSNGDKSINLVSSGLSFMPGSITNTSMFIRVNSLKKFTALYGAAASYGKLYREEIITGLGIAGFMYKGKIAKKVDATIILAGVYAPYTKYYTQTWFTNMPLIVPFVNVNYKMTKTFGIGLTGGTTYMAGENVINYQVLLGAKLIL